jgi:hypothetical protein
LARESGNEEGEDRVRITLWYYVASSGDGCHLPLFFRTEEQAREAYLRDDAEFGEGVEDNIGCVTINTEQYDVEYESPLGHQ